MWTGGQIISELKELWNGDPGKVQLKVEDHL